MAEEFTIPKLAAAGHTSHCNRCLSGLPFSQVSMDSTKLPFIFYCIGTLDILGSLNSKNMALERDEWKQIIWDLQTTGPYGTGFKPSSYMTSPTAEEKPTEEYSDYDSPHMIVTYTALLSLAILRDDFTRLDRPGLVKFLGSCQRPDGSFTTDPTGGDTDLRLTYCAFVICTLLNDWSGINVEKAIGFMRRCRSYEGGYGHAPGCESSGGPTYLALAVLRLSTPANSQILSPIEQRQTLRWLIQNQESNGGFRGRTGKEADACYCFWCGASIEILGQKDLVNSVALASYLGQCQFKFGGIAKAPGETADPYHTYLSLAALSIIPPPQEHSDETWKLEPLDALVNAREETAKWAKEHIRSS